MNDFLTVLLLKFENYGPKVLLNKNLRHLFVLLVLFSILVPKLNQRPEKRTQLIDLENDWDAFPRKLLVLFMLKNAILQILQS